MTTQPPSTRPVYRLFGSLRFVLALAVVFSHTWGLYFTTPGDHLAQQIGIGNVAVLGFFILSGFIIAEAISVFYPGRPLAFIGNRFMRLAPPFWAALLLSVAVHFVLAAMGTLKLPDYQTPPDGMFSAANLAVNVTGIFPLLNFNKLLPPQEYYYFVRFAWAVSVEFAFYLSVFVVAYILAWRFLRARVLVVLSVAGALAVHLQNEYAYKLHAAFAFIPYFTLGLSMYFWQVRKEGVALAAALLSYGLIFLHFVRYTQGNISPWADWTGALARPSVMIPVILMMLVPPLIFLLARLSGSARARELDSILGDLSYPLYLNHYPVLIVFYSLATVPGLGLQLSAVLLSVLLCWAMKEAVETPLTPLRNRLRGQALRG